MQILDLRGKVGKSPFGDLGVSRPVMDSSSLEKSVKKILDKVKKNGDKAVKKYAKEFDGVKLKKLQVTEKEIKEAIALVPDELKQAIQQAKSNIEKFHTAQLSTVEIITALLLFTTGCILFCVLLPV